MSYSVDVNVLLYASDTSSPKHAQAIRFLKQRPSDPDLFCIAWSTPIAFLRIATHPGIFAQPLSPDDALGNVESLLSLPRVRMLSEGEGFLETYREVTARLPTLTFASPPPTEAPPGQSPSPRCRIGGQALIICFLRLR